MPVKDQAAYMREYRAKRRKETVEAPGKILIQLAKDTPGGNVPVAELIAERDMLREEVHRLKRVIAEMRGESISRLVGPTNAVLTNETSFRQFRPAPKPGRK